MLSDLLMNHARLLAALDSSSLGAWVLWTVLGLGLGALLWFERMKAKARFAKVRRFAERVGFTYSDERPADLIDDPGTMNIFPLDARGPGGAFLVLRRPDFTLARYVSSILPSRMAPDHCIFTVIELVVPGAAFPRAIVTVAKPVGRLYRVKFDDAQVYAKDREFSEEFVLRGDDVIDVITPDLVELLRDQMFSFESEGDRLRICRAHLTPAAVSKDTALLEVAPELAKLLRPDLSVEFPDFRGEMTGNAPA